METISSTGDKAQSIVPEKSEDSLSNIVVQAKSISKNYGAVQALKEVNVEIVQGTIHGLLGENGAGKSTLVKIISGEVQPSSGKVFLNQQEVLRFSVSEMEKMGIFLVTQEPMIVDYISAAENLLLGIWPANKFGFIRWKQLYKDAEKMLEDTGINPRILAGKLDAVSKRKLNILRALFSGGRIIILDEPTASLTDSDRRQLFDYMNELKNEGVTFVFISHYNDEILEVCDAVTVLKDGVVSGNSHDVSKLSSDELTALVLGRDVDLFKRQYYDATGHIPFLQIKNVIGDSLSVETLNVCSNEIIGLTGLPGAGAKELVRAVFGLHPVNRGEFKLGEDNFAPLPTHPREALDLSIAYLSDDRRKDGFIDNMSIRRNISLSLFSLQHYYSFINRPNEKELTQTYFDDMKIKAPTIRMPVGNLSGGNQQKVCLGRVLAIKPKVLMIDEPTRGIDIGIKQEVLRMLDELSKEGVAVIVVSTDTDELARIADRVFVFQEGKIAHILHGEEITSDALRKLS